MMRMAAINGCLLSAVVCFFGIRNIYADYPSCSDDGSQRKSKCVLSTESGDNIAAYGQQVYLDCSTCADDSGPTVDWLYTKKSDNFSKAVLISYGKINKINDAKMDFHLADDNASLILNDVTVSNAGLYTCFCDGGFGDRKTSNLTVTEYMAVNVGSTATLGCYSSTSDVEWSYGKPTFWPYGARSRVVYSNGIVNDDLNERFSLPRSSPWNFSLVIEGVQIEDSGFYTCHEDGATASKQHTFQLITSVQADDGQPELSLPCWPSVEEDVVWATWPIENNFWASNIIYAEGEVRESYRDRFTVGPSKESMNSYTLTIKPVQSTDTGVYACVERSGHGDFHLIQLLVSNDLSSSLGSNQMKGTGCHSKELTLAAYALSTSFGLFYYWYLL